MRWLILLVPLTATADVLESAIEGAAQRLLAPARAAPEPLNFSRVIVSDAPVPPDAFRVRLTDAPSLFSADACNRSSRGPAPTVCRTEAGGVVCSRAAMQALVGFDPNHGPGRPSIPLMLVFAHEMGHLALGHRGGDAVQVVPIRGSTSERMAAVRSGIDQAAAQRQLEAAADAWAIDRLRAALGPEHRDPRSGRVGLDAIRLTFLEAHDASRCLGDDDRPMQSPPSEAFLKHHAATFLCDIDSRPEGGFLPVLRGSHPDWRQRIAAAHDLFPAGSRRAAPAGFEAAQQLANDVDGIQRFMEKNDPYPEVIKAIRTASLSFDPAVCGTQGPRPQCAPLTTGFGPPRNASTTWHEDGLPADGRLVVPGALTAVSFEGGVAWLASADPPRLHRWDFTRKAVRSSAAPCPTPAWFAGDGDGALIACSEPGAVGRLQGDRWTMYPLLPVKRADEEDPWPAQGGWVGALGGRRWFSAAVGPSNSFVAEWTAGGPRMPPADTLAGCMGFNQSGVRHLIAAGDRWIALNDGDAEGWVVPVNAAGPVQSFNATDWQVWGAENDREVGIPQSCRVHRGGVTCVTDTYLFLDPLAQPTASAFRPLKIAPERDEGVERVDFCDVPGARWLTGIRADGVWAVRLAADGSKVAFEEKDLAGTPRLWCGEQKGVLTLPGAGKTVLVPLQ